MVKKSFFISIIIHFMIWGGFCWLTRNNKVDDKAEDIINFELSYSHRESTVGTVQTGAVSIFPHLSASKIFSKVQNNREDSIDSDWNQTHKYSKNELSDFEGLKIGQVSFLKRLWKEIDNALVDSPYLSEFNFTGKIFIHFEIEPKGQLDEKNIKISAHYKVLKVIALRAVRKAIKNENRELVWPKEKVKINAQFAWSDYESCEKLRGVNKNYLSFCKYAENKRKDFSDGEQVATYLGALKYGVGGFEEIKKYEREKSHRITNFDPFESFKRDPDYNL